jgi:hypothetical protein
MDSVLRRAQQAEADGRIGVAARLYHRYCADTTTPKSDVDWVARRADELDQVVGAAAPPHLICPISLRLFTNPVILVETGQTYEHSQLTQWFAHLQRLTPPQPLTCPYTNTVLTDRFLSGDTPLITSNYALKSVAEAFRESFVLGQTITPSAEDGRALQSLRGLVNTALTVAMTGIRVLDITRLSVDLPSPADFSANADHFARPFGFTAGEWQVRDGWQCLVRLVCSVLCCSLATWLMRPPPQTSWLASRAGVHGGVRVAAAAGGHQHGASARLHRGAEAAAGGERLPGGEQARGRASRHLRQGT